MLRDIGNVLIFTSTLGSWVFCGLYTLLARWWASAAGRHMFSFSAAIGLVLTTWSIGLITGAGRAEWFQVLRLVVFVPVPVVIWWRVWLLVQVNGPGIRKLVRSARRPGGGSVDGHG